jgi:hypothetical protein
VLGSTKAEASASRRKENVFMVGKTRNNAVIIQWFCHSHLFYGFGGHIRYD